MEQRSPFRGLVIVALSRSGSSMTAGLFVQHGAWCGRCLPPDERNAKGYFENQDFKRALLEEYGRDSATRPTKPGPAWERFEPLLPCEQPWIVKFGAWYEREVPAEYPRLVVRRDLAAVNASRARLGWRHDTHHLGPAKKRLDELEAAGAWRVDAERLVAHDFQQLEKPLEYLGLSLDPERARAFVDPKLLRPA